MVKGKNVACKKVRVVNCTDEGEWCSVAKSENGIESEKGEPQSTYRVEMK